MTRMNKRKRAVYNVLGYIVLTVFALVMIFPLIWMFLASFKTNQEIFGSLKLLPSSFSFQAYIDGWRGVGGNTYTRFFKNTFLMVIPTVLLTVVSSSLVAYGFSRFQFKGKNIMFTILLATMMLPNAVLIIPRYTIFRMLGVLDSYWPFYLTAGFACAPFFTYMLMQFFRGVPMELDESAYIDGAGTFQTFIHILLPLMKPSLFSAGLFQFLWTYNDYFNSLVYINSVKKYTVSLALKLSLDAESVVQWNKVMAMSFVAVLPVVVLFFFTQRYFVEGVATSGIKG